MPDRFIAKPAAPARCRGCRANVLRAVSEGVPITVDRLPLAWQPRGNTAPHLAEAGAWLLGYRTFVQLDDGTLYERDTHRVRYGSLAGPIHQEHHCNGGQA